MSDKRAPTGGTTPSEPNLQALRPRARILRVLGEELISNDVVALIELVKNSYDADATRVLVKFNGPLEAHIGSVEVVDDGHGMSMDTIRTAWMEPATRTKRDTKLSEQKKRRVLGEKGVGRFACSRLADELVLISKRADEVAENYAVFYWTQFDDESKYLDEVLIPTEERSADDFGSDGITKALWTGRERPKPEDLSHGTVVRLNLLKRKWETKDFEVLQRGLSRLVSPFVDLADFTIYMHLPEEFASYSQEITPPKLIGYPHYSLKASISATGECVASVHVHASGQEYDVKGSFRRAPDSDEILMIESLSASDQLGRVPECGPFDVELRVWDRDELDNLMQVTGSTLRDIRRDLDSVAGINVYRDGFRVLPYGEPDNDWLRLNIRRVQNPTGRLSNNQIVGYVRISADKNSELRDQSNREGLQENQALADLRSILLQLLTQVENVRYPLRDRRRAQPSAQKGGLFSAFSLQPLKERVSAKHPKDTATIEAIDETEKQMSARLKDIQEILSRYQRLATLGRLIDVVLHDGRQPLAAILNEALLGRESLETGKNRAVNMLPVLLGRFGTIETQGGVLRTVFNRMEPFGGRRRGRPTQLYLEKVIANAFAVFENQTKKLGVRVALPTTETLVRVDDGEIQEVIVNLLDNSLYWLQHVDKRKRMIAVDVERIAPDNVQITFADSGPGVPKKNRALIFEPYFSTKPHGVGLGLAIAGEIVSDYYDGKLELLDSGALGGAAFRITLRKRV
jgi:signal transduction histidine kinase